MTTYVGTPVPVEEHHYENGILSQGDVFMYKPRECKSAPARAFEDETSASSSSSRSSSTSSSPSTQKKPRKPKKHKSSSSWSCKKLMYFIFCHAPEFTSWATSYRSTSRIKYLTLFFLEAFFRSTGDVTFCNNPFSGLLIFLGMLISCPHVTFLAFVTLTFGIETAVVLIRVPLNEVRSGGVTFNHFLTGTVVALLAQNDVLLAFPDIILTCIGVGILTSFVWKGVNGLLASRLEFPLLNAPFHIMILLYMLSGMSARYEEQHTAQIEGIPSSPLMIGNSTLDLKNRVDFINIVENVSLTNPLDHENTGSPPSMNSLESPRPLNWEKVFCGISLAPSHVFGTNSIATCMLVYTAILIYSPLMLMQAVIGATIGTLIGICLSAPDQYEMVYDGSWAYNPLFTSAALGGFFLIFNVYSWLLSLVGAVLTAVLYSAMVKLQIPALGIPFMLTTWLLLPSIPLIQPEVAEINELPPSQGPYFRLRLGQITTPELNRSLLAPEEHFDPTDKYKSQGSATNLYSSTNSILPL